ncbi:hypothetical protein XELAEV_18047236mg [Xenopus laevis]|uniref:DAGKc domain-containing protein n=1 Tax=Xenopus laevis TaxID=8355 RepID=A0A974BUG9_XENLA|nr:hypothetical protein XELAEV_18047236mg [Xenopus laevis]
MFHTGSTSLTHQQKEVFIDLKDFSVKLKQRCSAGQTKDCSVHLHNQSEDYCEIWFKQLKEILNGSTNVLAYSLHGAKHAVTAALHMIMGNIQPVDTCTFSNNSKLLQFGFSAMFGFGGRMDAFIPKKFAFLNLKPESCELTFLPLQNEEVRYHADQKKKREKAAYCKDPWQHIQGQLLNESIMAILCLCSMAPEDWHPIPELKVSVRNNSNYGKSTPEPNGNGNMAEGICALNINGDLMEFSSDIHVRLHPEINIYGTNIEELDGFNA